MKHPLNGGCFSLFEEENTVFGQHKNCPEAVFFSSGRKIEQNVKKS